MANEFKNYAGEEIAGVKFEVLLAQSKEKNDVELSEQINSATQMVMISAMMSGSDEPAYILLETVRTCINLACGKQISAEKKAAIIAASPEPFQKLMRQQDAIFFENTTDVTSETIETLLSSLPVAADSIFEILLAYALVGGEVNNEALDRIKAIYEKHNSYNVLDSLIHSGILQVDNESAYRDIRGEQPQKGPNNKNWESVVLNDGTLEITGYKGKDTSVIVPAEIGGISVSTLGGYCMSPNKDGLRQKRRDLYRSLTKIVISEGIKKIDGYAFESCESLEEIEMPYGLVQIGTRVFNCCENLKQIIVPETVSVIGDDAFCCGSLEILKMPTNPVRTMGQVSSYHSLTEPVYSGDMTKIYCYPLKSKVADFVIPEGVKYITEGIFGRFNGIKGLKTVRVPEGVETIGNFTFSNYIKKVYLPNSIQELAFAAFGCEDKIKTVICTTNPYVIDYANKNKIKVVEE